MLLLTIGLMSVFMCIAGFFKGVMDYEMYNHIFKTWLKKYKLEKNKLIKDTKKYWYYLWIYTPKYKEKFVYSTTFLVFLTDRWHFFQFLFLRSIGLALTVPIYYLGALSLFNSLLIGFIIMPAMLSVCFQIEHSYQQIKKK